MKCPNSVKALLKASADLFWGVFAHLVILTVFANGCFPKVTLPIHYEWEAGFLDTCLRGHLLVHNSTEWALNELPINISGVYQTLSDPLYTVPKLWLSHNSPLYQHQRFTCWMSSHILYIFYICYSTNYCMKYSSPWHQGFHGRTKWKWSRHVMFILFYNVRPFHR